jgi:major intracellular serine protease
MRIPMCSGLNAPQRLKLARRSCSLRSIRWLFGVWMVLVALGCRGALQQPTLSAEHGEGVPRQFLDRQVIVTLAPASAEQWARMATALAQTYGLPQVGAFPLASLGVQCVVLQVPEERAMTEVLTILAADPLVESVQPNRFFQSQGVAHNDPYATLQYGVKALRADFAHHVVTGKGVQIAVIDTGVDTEHPDLRDGIRKTANFVERGEQTFTQDYHGTAVVGVLAARANNDLGILGVAPEADILALKACWQRTATSRQALCSSWTLAKAVDFAILEGAQILNFSLAGPFDPLLARLLTKAATHGMVVVAAAFEQEQRLGFPASLDTVMAILSSDPQGKVRFPAAGQHPLLAAPGVDILTTLPHSAYDFVSGSSMAAAHVSGIVALLLEGIAALQSEQYPTFSLAQLHTLLQSTARPVAVQAGTATATVGFIDIGAALCQIGHVQLCP